MTSVAFTIPGKPFAKQRPRATRQGRPYTPKETVSFERTVGQIAALHFPEPMRGPLEITIRAQFAVPKSWSKARTREALQTRWHTQRPDLDNLVKAVLDGLNRIAFADDAQIAVVVCDKTWVAGEPETSVRVRGL